MGPASAQAVPDGLLALGSGSMEQLVQAWRDDYRARTPGTHEKSPEGAFFMGVLEAAYSTEMGISVV